MSRNAIPLSEYQIYVAFDKPGYFSVWTRQLRYDEYPPPLRVMDRKVVSEPGSVGGVSSKLSVPIENFHSARVSSTEFQDREVLRQVMAELTQRSLPHYGAELNEFLLGLPSWHSGSARITIVYDEPMLDGIPWELLCTDERQMDQPRCPVIRRYPVPSREKTGIVDLPLNVLLESATRRIEEHEIQDWGKDLFDDFTRYAR